MCSFIPNQLSINLFGFLSLALSNQSLLIYFHLKPLIHTFFNILTKLVLFFLFRKRNRCISAICWVAGFADVSSYYWSIFYLFGWHFARSIRVCPFVHTLSCPFVHSLLSFNMVYALIHCLQP